MGPPHAGLSNSGDWSHSSHAVGTAAPLLEGILSIFTYTLVGFDPVHAVPWGNRVPTGRRAGLARER